MAFGFGVLRRSSDEFWAMTPRELGAAMDGAYGRASVGPLARATLDTLMSAFPDGSLP